MNSSRKYLARKISKAKWQVQRDLMEQEIGADAITSCLRTLGNRLSVWHCESKLEDVEEVVLALATAMQRFETLDILLLDRRELLKKGFSLEQTYGRTAVEDLRNRHSDIIKLSTTKVCRLAEHVALKVRKDLDCYRFTKRQVSKIVCRAIQRKRVSLESLDERLQEDVKKLCYSYVL